MNDTEYHQMVDDIFIELEAALDNVEADLDYESAGGILTIIFPDTTKIILNKQPPLHQIWVATKFNGHHFNLQGEQWIDERSGAEFWSFMDQAATKQAGQSVRFR